MKQGLTEKQRRALDFIEEFHGEKRFMPSIAEISKACGLKSKTGAGTLVNALIKRGYLVKGDGARSMALREWQ